MHKRWRYPFLGRPEVKHIQRGHVAPWHVVAQGHWIDTTPKITLACKNATLIQMLGTAMCCCHSHVHGGVSPGYAVAVVP